MPQPEEVGEATLELLGVSPAGQPEVERGIDQVLQFPGVEDASGHGHDGASENAWGAKATW